MQSETEVYIDGFGSALPNAPVTNDKIESVLGEIHGRPSRSKRLVLQSNGIQSRHYAIDPETRQITHTNSGLTALAVLQLLEKTNVSAQDIDGLYCGTSSADQLIPNHAAMVHGESILGLGPMDLAAMSGVCCASLVALNYAFLRLKCGLGNQAIVTGSELASTALRAEHLQSPEDDALVKHLADRPSLAFEADFLRWMLSDGASAALITNQKFPNHQIKTRLRIDWIDIVSFANELKTCMYAGATRDSEGNVAGWRSKLMPQALKDGSFRLCQDSRYLAEHIVTKAIGEGLSRLQKKYRLDADSFRWFVPHYSSDYFRPLILKKMQEIECFIPQERWSSNLASVGNVGSASLFLLLQNLVETQPLLDGDKILVFVPESARFTVGYMQLTVCQ